MATLTNTTDLTGFVASLINDIYPDTPNLGKVDTMIAQGCNTSDFEISEQYKLRVKETKQGVYYSIFRS